MHHRGGSIALIAMCGLMSFPNLLLFAIMYVVFPDMFWVVTHAAIIGTILCIVFRKFVIKYLM